MMKNSSNEDIKKTRRIQKLSEIAKRTSAPISYDRAKLNQIRLKKHNKMVQNQKNLDKHNRINFVRRHKSEMQRRYQDRRLERLVLEEESGQPSLRVKKSEEYQISKMDFKRKKQFFSRRQNLSKSIHSTGVNLWNNVYLLSPKSVRNLVRSYS